MIEHECWICEARFANRDNLLAHEYRHLIQDNDKGGAHSLHAKPAVPAWAPRPGSDNNSPSQGEIDHALASIAEAASHGGQ